jgi:hypothetical protein
MSDIIIHTFYQTMNGFCVGNIIFKFSDLNIKKVENKIEMLNLAKGTVFKIKKGNDKSNCNAYCAIYIKENFDEKICIEDIKELIPKNMIKRVEEKNKILLNKIKETEKKHENFLKEKFLNIEKEFDNIKMLYINLPDLNLKDFTFKVKLDQRLLEKSFFYYCINEVDYSYHKIIKQLYFKHFFDNKKNIDYNKNDYLNLLSYLKLINLDIEHKTEIKKKYIQIFNNFLNSSRFYAEGLMYFIKTSFLTSIEYFFDALQIEKGYFQFQKLKRFHKIEK